MPRLHRVPKLHYLSTGGHDRYHTVGKHLNHQLALEVNQQDCNDEGNCHWFDAPLVVNTHSLHLHPSITWSLEIVLL